MQVGDLIRHNKPSSRYEFDQIGLVLEVQSHFQGYTKIKVLWSGDELALWMTPPQLKPLTFT